MRYGHLHEAHARNSYLIDEYHKDATITRTGFHNNPSHNWIGASPDELVYDPSSINVHMGYWN